MERMLCKTLAFGLAVMFFALSGRAQATNLMPQGFESVFMGMSSNQLSQVRPNLEWPGDKSPHHQAIELLQNRVFFDGAGFDFFPSGGLAVIYFYPTANEQSKRSVLPGFVKGCIAKYGTNYEQRVNTVATQPPMKVAILRWTNDDAVVVTAFISDANRTAYKSGGGGEMPLFPYRLLIYHKDAVSLGGGTNYLGDITQSVPANQDTTGQAFTNFPAFLNSYNGPIWQ